MSNISDFVKKHTSSACTIEQLPLLHSCDCFACRQIIDCEKLEARHCKVFKENLLYFFYGKPAYPVSEKETKKRTAFEYCPVCFIVPCEKVAAYRVFPFDTGALEAHKYDDFWHHSMSLDNFELDNTVDGIRQYVEVFFGSNYNYIQGQASIEKATVDPYINGLTSLLTANGAFEIDERARTIEVISRNDVPVNTAVECIILPEILLREPEISKYLEDNKIYHMEYSVRKLTAPSRYNEVVFQKAMEYIRMQKGGV